ncbi:MAG: AAA family ATPase [Oscillospiraceae bacterium]
MKKPFIVGIAGGSASGKTTFCSILEKELCEFNLKIFHMDDYFKPNEERPFVESPITGKMYVDDNQPETIDIARLKLDLQSALETEYELIVIEGLFTLWDKEIYSKLDLKLYVDCKPDERIVRRIKRNLGWGLTFDEITTVYLDMVRYRHDEYVEPTKWKADIILNGSNLSTQSVCVITNFIKTSCHKL